MSWGTVKQYKANFHTHTTESDGNRTPDTVIADYSDKGYSILALTDHDNMTTHETTWPWTTWISEVPNPIYTDVNGMETSALYPTLGGSDGLLAVRGNEITRPDHIGSFFNDYGATSTTTEEVALQEIENRNGLAMMYHPGRYSRADSWYESLYNDYHYSPLIGMEVYNQGDRYPGDRARWDRVNALVMPDITIFGYSNDDMHKASHLFRNYQFMLMEGLTEAALSNAMFKGAFYFCYEPDGNGTPQVPSIEEISVDGTVITITATDATSITWQSNNGQVGTGNSIDISQLTEGTIFVRAELVNSSGKTYTQPFVLGYEVA